MPELSHAQPQDNLLDQLKEMPLFKAFDDKYLQGLLNLSALRRYEPGEFIIDESYDDQCIYFLISGSVRIIKHNKEVSVLRRRGEVFGEMSVIDGSSRSASAYAIDETTCLVTDSTQVNQFSGDDSLVFFTILYRTFAEILAERLRSTTEELVQAKEQIERLNRQE